MRFFRESALEPKQLLEGITLKAVSGDKAMMTFFEFEPHALIPHHRHMHEQITYVIKGEIEFTVDGETRLLGSGDGVIILSNQEHSARILDKPAKALDAWYPIREDYRCTLKESED
ncbi:MAG TPA: cupin domain-containing protein [Thermodesulfovibrionales bacterium]|nr:cupin domain-containing protein [Thermodesulfovibrionales bacterium]